MVAEVERVLGCVIIYRRLKHPRECGKGSRAALFDHLYRIEFKLEATERDNALGYGLACP